MSIYRDGFSDVEDIVSSFCLTAETLQGVEILFAEYNRYDHEGDAWVIFKKDNKLYEVGGSHCSCNGLENQWVPQISSAKAILMMPRVKEDVELRDLILSLIN